MGVPGFNTQLNCPMGNGHVAASQLIKLPPNIDWDEVPSRGKCVRDQVRAVMMTGSTSRTEFYWRICTIRIKILNSQS